MDPQFRLKKSPHTQFLNGLKLVHMAIHYLQFAAVVKYLNVSMEKLHTGLIDTDNLFIGLCSHLYS